MENELAKRDESLPFRLMDALDDKLIIDELEGRMPEVLTYHFQDKGQEVWGLSKAGVDEATGELAKQGEVIREIDLGFVDGKDEAFFTVKAGRYVISKDGQEVLLDTKFGTKRQPKKTAKGNDNVFWYEQGSIKACRNASMRLIPKTIVQAVIENAKKVGKVKEVKPNGEQKAEGKEEPPHSPPDIEPLTINQVTVRTGETKGKAWNLFTIHASDGNVYTTFDKKIAELAKKFKENDTPCWINFDETPKGKNLKEIQEYAEKELEG